MEMKIIGGKALGAPIGGGTISLNGNDAKAVIDATSGLIKNLAIVGGGVALAIGLLSLLKEDSNANKVDLSVPFNVLGIFKANCNKFYGVLLCDEIELKISNGQILKIPISWIKEYRTPHGRFFDGSPKNFNQIYRLSSSSTLSSSETYFNIVLFDGSEYCGEICNTDFDVLTLLGVQKIIINSTHEIESCKLSSIKRLRDNISIYAEEQKVNLLSVLGEENFNLYFGKTI